MLLYDRLIEHVERLLRKIGPSQFGRDSAKRLDVLKKLPVYDITNVAGLFHSFYDLEKPVPRRPPHENLWVEWSMTHRDHADETAWPYRVGCVVLNTDLSELQIVDGKEHRLGPIVASASRVYKTQMFRSLEARPEGLEPCDKIDKMVRHLCADIDLQLWLLDERGCHMDAMTLRVSDRDEIMGENEVDISRTMFGLPFMSLPRGSSSIDPIWTPWPAWASFALLHCKNVVTQEEPPDPAVQRRVLKQGLPKRATSRVLRIVAPRLVEQRRGPGQESDRRLRFHIRAGHFKNLQHPRYKDPGWHWWQECCVGDPELGTVSGPRKIVSGGA